jgi:hypothetical protein
VHCYVGAYASVLTLRWCIQGGGGPQTLREMAMNEQAMEGYGRPDMQGGMVGGLPPWARMGREPEG